MRRKMILSHILVLLLFAACTYFFVLQTVYHMVQNNILQETRETMNRWTSDLSSVMGYGRSYILNLAANEDIQDALRSRCRMPDHTLDNSEIQETVQLLENHEFVRQIINPRNITLNNFPFLITIYYRTPSGGFMPAYSGKPGNPDPQETYSPEHTWIRSLEAQNGQFLWSRYSDANNEYVRLSKIVYNTQDYSQEIGIIALDISYTHLTQNILIPLRTQSGIQAAIYDCRTLEAIDYYPLPIQPEINLLISNNEKILEHKESCLFTRLIPGTDYCLVGIKSLNEIKTIYIRSCQQLIFVALGALLLGLILTMTLSHQILKPVISLSHTMKDIKNGDLDITVSTRETGEIGELYNSFNYMIQMINHLIEDNYAVRLRQKQSELNALQSQINTHFLYNTLDSINWLAKDYHASDISYLVTNLSTLLRTSLNNGNPELTVAAELSHVRSYINIQKIRFHDLFQVREDIDESALNDQIIKMLLQPLVENAILHSFNRRDREISHNLLTLKILAQEQSLLLEVSHVADPEDLYHIQQILSQPMDSIFSSYGILSIKSRLAIAYGAEATYSYSMDEQNQLTASICIPRSYTRQNRITKPNTGEGTQ